MMKLKLNTKISLIAVLSIVIAITILGVYFDMFLKDIYFIDAKHRILDAREKIKVDIKNQESELIKGISFIKDDKQMLASVSLINNYQDKKNYNAILLDEEKKDLTEQLLKRVKISFNSDIVLYDKNEELIAFVVRDEKGYRLNFISYENSKKFLYTKYERDSKYLKEEYKDKSEYPFKHISYYTQPDLKSTTPITYHYMNNSLYIRAHKSIFNSKTGNTIVHIEMSYKMGAVYFKNISSNLNMNISMTDKPSCQKKSLPLFQKSIFKDNDIVQNKRDYHVCYKIVAAKDQTTYIIISLEKSILNIALNKNRMELLFFLVLLTLITLIILYYLFNSILSQPLNRLMKNIFKIEKGDYSESAVIKSNDELEEISINVNNLAKAVNARESQLIESQKKLEYLSTHDELTGLLNRRLFNRSFEQALENAKIKELKLALLFIDLDQFKQVNDTLGHIVGDDLLVQVANRLSSYLGENNTLGRIGGDEFTIFVESFERRDEVESFAQNILDEFHTPFVCGEYEINITASIGIAVYPYDGFDYVTLSKNADLAMYKSKDVGRNNYSFFSVEFSNYLEKRANVINALKVALQNKDEFILLYQPKISIETKKIVGIEALIRWNSSVLGFVTPDEFISVAEDTHMIIEIGKWVLNKACSDFVKLKSNACCSIEQISINVSAVQLQYSDMIESVKETIAQTNISAKEIELEVTESYTATNEINVIETLSKFREMGISLAIDDFGTGYSSLSYLQKLPITRLKIDKAFVDDLPNSTESVAVVNAIIALAQSFNLKITVEGVETIERVKFFEDKYCDDIQGYVYSKPISFDELKEFVANNS